MYADLDATITCDDPKGNVVASLTSTSFLKSRRGFNINDLRVFSQMIAGCKTCNHKSGGMNIYLPGM